MEESSINPIKYVVIGLLLLGIIVSLIFLPLVTSKAQDSNQSGSQSLGFTNNILGGQPAGAGQSNSGGFLSGLFSGSGAKADPIITIVNAPGQTEIYRIINGRKHLIPTDEIFFSYGLSASIIQGINEKELAKYPRARLFVVEDVETEDGTQVIYYLTEGGMIRPIINDKVFNSYGNRMEDVITINQKEFNYYPENQYVFVERPKMNRDIYQITGGIKRYLTPVAVRRMNIKEYEIAPISQIEFDAYPNGESVIF